MIACAGKAGLQGADEAAARLRENARTMHERAAEARTRLQSIHVSQYLKLHDCLLFSCLLEMTLQAHT